MLVHLPSNREARGAFLDTNYRGEHMKVPVTAATLVVGLFLINPGPAFSQERGGLLTREQTRAYHACLFEAWIQDYCGANSRAYGQCLVANGGERYPLGDRRFTDDYCWYTAQGLPPR
jgi:hypothetical protein